MALSVWPHGDTHPGGRSLVGWARRDVARTLLTPRPTRAASFRVELRRELGRSTDHVIAAVQFAVEHRPDEGGPWRLVLKNWEPPVAEVDGKRRLLDVLRRLPRSKVATWELQD